MVNYAGTVRAADIPAVGLSWTVKGTLFIIASTVLSVVVLTPILLLAALAVKSLCVWLGLEAG